ncbi:MAG: sigma 54 modulation/S30EA ribosomal C-terminal domain-containing protein [Peptococcaceae bacterium]|nr:sigma 54 modulation/S30EA ribosomal C-terminal domain-containing protein [Peptococcaceae bacterium]
MSDCLFRDVFFVFLHAETNAVNVVYKRKDGQYGLIQPIID